MVDSDPEIVEESWAVVKVQTVASACLVEVQVDHSSAELPSLQGVQRLEQQPFVVEVV